MKTCCGGGLVGGVVGGVMGGTVGEATTARSLCRGSQISGGADSALRHGWRILVALLALSATLGFAQESAQGSDQESNPGSIGEILFARGERDVEPVDATDSFEEGVRDIYAFFEFENLSATDVISGAWHYEGSLALTQATTTSQVLNTVADVPEGQFFFLLRLNEGAQPGIYRLDLSLNGSLMRSAEFEVVANNGQDEAAQDEAAQDEAAQGEAGQGEAGQGSAVERAAPLPDDAVLLFSDDFEDPRSGWGTFKGDVGTLDYQGGRFVISLNGSNLPATSVHAGVFSDVVIEVDTITLAGPRDNAVGIAARYQDNGNYYAFAINAAGYFAILHFVDGAFEWDVPWTEATDGGIAPEIAENSLRIEADGRTMSFFVNGQLRGRVEDALWAEGQVGVFGAVFNEPGVEVGFDEWRVWSLPEGW
ncbi:MAG: hypothetical protein WD273_06350 [Trueperaceae bacterium]